MKRHREDLAHREMVGAFTTAAVINSGFSRPEEPVSALAFMPNHQHHVSAEPQMTDEELAAESEYNLKVLRLKLRMQKEQDRG